MNIDSTAVEQAITPRTKVIVALHYAGISCDMQSLRNIANKYGLKIVEDAAQAVFSSYQGIPCGALADYGCFSFHESKNLHCGEGGALILNHIEDVEKAEILLEKGTNRMSFFRGEQSKYEWVGMGSSYVPSELNAAFLLCQLEAGKHIISQRLSRWQRYHELLQRLVDDGIISTPTPPADGQHNAHIFWIKLPNKEKRDALIGYLKQHGIGAAFHYIPLHSAPAGTQYGEFVGEDRYTTNDSNRLLRLPLFYGMQELEVEEVVAKIFSFLSNEIASE